MDLEVVPLLIGRGAQLQEFGETMLTIKELSRCNQVLGGGPISRCRLVGVLQYLTGAEIPIQLIGILWAFMSVPGGHKPCGLFTPVGPL